MGQDCIYICGTDEYGTATEMEAQKLGVHPREIVEKNRRESYIRKKRLSLLLNLRCPI